MYVYLHTNDTEGGDNHGLFNLLLRKIQISEFTFLPNILYNTNP